MDAPLLPATTASPDETRAVGRRLAAFLAPGDTLALSGELGAGKTCFVQGVVEGLGGNPADVSSPTFTIAHEYAARIPVYHMDLYRLGSLSEARAAGLLEYFERMDGICLVEWPERVADLMPPGTDVLVFAHAAGGRRTISRG